MMMMKMMAMMKFGDKTEPKDTTNDKDSQSKQVTANNVRNRTKVERGKDRAPEQQKAKRPRHVVRTTIFTK